MILDNLDRMLIEALENDARQSIQALAREFGVKRTTVRYRLDRLRSKGILTIACAVNLELVGYLLLIGINVSPGKADMVANQMAPLPDVKVVCLTHSRYDILVWVRFRDQSGFAHFLSKEIPKIPDITAIEAMHAYHWIRNPFFGYHKPQEKFTVGYPRNHLSDLDLSVIKAMEKDPRQTIAQLSRAVGCSKLVAKTTLERLLNDGIIKMVSYVDPTAQEYEIGVAILIKVKPDNVYTIANDLSAQQMTRYVFLVTGRWEILFGAQFKNTKHLYGFLSEKLTAFPGIIEHEVIHLVKTLKYYMGFLNAE